MRGFQRSSIATTTARSSQHTQYNATTHSGFSARPIASLVPHPERMKR
jgi:hypothetical protein